MKPYKTLAMFAVSLLVSAVACRAANSQRADLPLGEKPAAAAIPLAATDDAIGLSLRPAARSSTQIALDFAGGGKKVLTLEVRAQTGKRRSRQAGGTANRAKPAYDQVEAKDSFVAVSGTNLRIFARPNLVRYTDPQQDELLRKWDSLPAASQTFMHYRVPESARPRGNVDQRLLCRACFPPRAVCGRSRFPCPRRRPSGKRHRINCPQSRRSTARWTSAGSPSRAPCGKRGCRWSRGCIAVQGIPLIVADGPGNGDVGVVREMKGSWALECDEHLSRTPFDGMPETLHFSVPQAFYHKAYVLCAAEPDPAQGAGADGADDAFRHVRGEAMRWRTLPSGCRAAPSGRPRT